MRDDGVQFEHKDIRYFAVIVTGFAVLLGALAAVFLLWFVFEYFKGTHPALQSRPGLAPVFGTITQPVLQSAPPRDLQELRARDDRILNGYNWVDRNKGTVSIPIDRAIDKLLSNGMPAPVDYSDLKLTTPRGGSRQTGF